MSKQGGVETGRDKTNSSTTARAKKEFSLMIKGAFWSAATMEEKQ